jgi:hypothetical protein
MKPLREVTNKILGAIDEGLLTPQQVAEAALRFLSEDDVAKMAHNEEFFVTEDDADDEDELAKVYDDAWELSEAFEDYCFNNLVKMSKYWEGMAENWNSDEFGDYIDDRGFETIAECIGHFC